MERREVFTRGTRGLRYVDVRGSGEKKKGKKGLNAFNEVPNVFSPMRTQVKDLSTALAL